jgi:hypothetical protein
MDIAGEFSGAEFGDERLSRRLSSIAERLGTAPGNSFPKAMHGGAELEATYRFLGNESVTPEEILAPHIARTVSRMESERLVVVAHDTTLVTFATAREGLGRSSGAGLARSFFMHAALAISGDATHRTLGVLGVETHVRTKKSRRKETHHTERNPESKRESRRWIELVRHAAEQAGSELQTRLIHVMDREADDYTLLARMVEGNHRFVVRMRHDRQVEHTNSTSKVSRVLAKLEPATSRQIAVSSYMKPFFAEKWRKPLIRSARTATLQLSGERVVLLRPNTPAATRRPLPEQIEISVVHLSETNPPAGEAPITWTLWSSEPITSASNLDLIVDAYVARWRIEEYFKAFKSGCAFESRQLESATTIYNAMAVYIPIAWALLELRTMARHQPQRPAVDILSELQIKLLQRHKDIQLEKDPTIGDAMLAIAKLGGHIKNNGEPGWMILARGFHDLLLLEKGAFLVLQTTCDQS